MKSCEIQRFFTVSPGCQEIRLASQGLPSYLATEPRISGKKTCLFLSKILYIYMYIHMMYIYVYIYMYIICIHRYFYTYIKEIYLSIYIYIYMYCSKAHIVYLFLYFIQDLAITIRDPQVIRIRLHTWTCHGGTVSGTSSMYSTCLNSVK